MFEEQGRPGFPPLLFLISLFLRPPSSSGGGGARQHGFIYEGRRLVPSPT